MADLSVNAAVFLPLRVITRPVVGFVLVLRRAELLAASALVQTQDSKDWL